MERGAVDETDPRSNSGSLAGLALTAQTLMLATNGPFLGVAELSNGVALVVGL